MTSNAAPPAPSRVLVVDDNPSILEDFRKTLVPEGASAELSALEAALFGDSRPSPRDARVELSFANQGAEALTVVERAAATGWSFDVAFVDVRMPPGFDGVETVLRLWRIDPGLQVVLCTAYSDYEWEDMVERLGAGDGYLVLKKPFDGVEVRQLVNSLGEKRALLVEREARLAELDRMVLDRTAALAEANARLAVEMGQRLAAEQRLHQSQKLESLGRLAAYMGHEINNPLSYVQANVEDAAARLATGGPIDPCERAELCTMLDETVPGVKRIATLVRHLKVFSRAQPEPTRPFALNDVIDSALVLLGNEIRTRATLRRELAEGLSAVSGDPGRIEQVLINLLINAVQSIPSGDTAGNTIRVVSRAAGPDEVIVEISDTGGGIEARDLERVFEAFYTTKLAGEGTGLGLAICRSIVEAHRGRIWIDSVVGSGTTVGLALPT